MITTDDLYVYKAKIIDIYDGDTMTAEVDLGFKIKFTMRLRLLGIDTPELRRPELEEGRRVRDLVKEKLLNQDVLIKTEKDSQGKYGRYLATIYHNNVNINEWLVETGNAKRY